MPEKTTATTGDELARLRGEVHGLTLAVGFLGEALFAVGHRVPPELAELMGAWRAHAAAAAPALGPNERRIGGVSTNAGMDAEVARAALDGPGRPAPAAGNRYAPVTNDMYGR